MALALLAAALLVLLALPIRALGGAPLPDVHHVRPVSAAVVPATADLSPVASSSRSGAP